MSFVRQFLPSLLLLLALVQAFNSARRSQLVPDPGLAWSTEPGGLLLVGNGATLPAGLRPGDVVLAVGGTDLNTIAQVRKASARVGVGRTSVRLRREGDSDSTVDVDAAALAALPLLETGPCLLVTQQPIEGRAAQRAGIAKGDIIVAIDGSQPASKSPADPVLRATGYQTDSLVERLATIGPGESLRLEWLHGTESKEASLSFDETRAIIAFTERTIFPHAFWVSLLIAAFATAHAGGRSFLRGGRWEVLIRALFAGVAAYYAWMIASMRPLAAYGWSQFAADAGAAGAFAMVVLSATPPAPGRRVRGSIWWVQLAAFATAVGLFMAVRGWDATLGEPTGSGRFDWLRRMSFHEGPFGQSILFVLLYGCAGLAITWWRMLRLRAEVFSTELLRLRRTRPRDPSHRAVHEGLADAIDQQQDDWHRLFVPIMWTEVAMPILGFLGTVVGFADALPPLRRLLEQRVEGTASDPGAANAAMSKALAECIDGLALAFNTTFLGLAGILIVGIGHVALRASMRRRFVRVADDLAREADRTGTTSEVFELGMIQAGIASVREAMGRVQRFTDAMIAKGRTPFWEDARRVAFESIVEFEEEPHPAIKELLSGKLGEDWSFVDVAAGGQGRDAYALVAAGDRQYLAHLSLGRAETALFALPSPSRYNGVIWTDDRPVLVARGPTSCAVVMAQFADDHVELEEDAHKVSQVLPWTFGTRTLLLFVDAARGSLAWAASDGKRGELAKLGAGVLGDCVVSTASGVIHVVTVEGGRAFVHRLAPTADHHGWPLALAVPPDRVTPVTRLAEIRGAAPEQAIALTADELLLAHDAKLSCWTVHRDRPAPVPNVEVGPGKPLLAGRSGWFAVVRNNELAMWKLVQQTVGVQYVDAGGAPRTFPTGSVDGFRVSADGRFVLGWAGQALLTWSFPVARMDV